MKKYLQLLKEFQRWNPEVVNQMKNCSHHYNSDNISPYHIEDDVWTHTAMMYKDFMTILTKVENKISTVSSTTFDEKKYNEMMDILAVCILCHDIGKIYTRHVPNGQYGKIAFYNHSFASIQKTIDFIFYINEWYYLNEDQIYAILNVISNHMDVHNFIKNDLLDLSEKSMKDLIKYANGDRDICIISILMNLFDKRNAIDDNMKFLSSDYDIFHFIKYHDYTSDKKVDNSIEANITIYCGVPGCGKDYISLIKDDITFSYDDIRIKKYKENNEDKELSSSELYKNAWEYCNTEKIDLNKLLKEMVINAITENKTVGIANTNLSRKARRSLVNLFKDYTIKIVYIISESNIMVCRNNNRKSKNLDRLVMNKFMYNQQIPCMKEFENNKNVVDIQLIEN